MGMQRQAMSSTACKRTNRDAKSVAGKKVEESSSHQQGHGPLWRIRTVETKAGDCVVEGALQV